MCPRVPRLFIESIVDVEESVSENFWDRFDTVLIEPLNPAEVPVNLVPVPEVISRDQTCEDNVSVHSADTLLLVDFRRTYCPGAPEDLG